MKIRVGVFFGGKSVEHEVSVISAMQAIAALDQPTSRILAAQAADELLNISGITASFVLYPDDGQTIISARSIGSANVQVILEPLGGGGNAATAGAQMKNVDVQEALDKLIASIDAFYEE